MKRALALILLFSAACSQPALPNDDDDAQKAARPSTPLSDAQRVASPLTREWLIGYWAYAGNCQSDLETALWPDGTYSMGDGGGRWSLSGATLTMNLERRPSIEFMQIRLGDEGPSRVRKTGPDEIQVNWDGGIAAGGAGGRFVRCD